LVLPLIFKEILMQDAFIYSVFLVVSYFLLGASIKYIDDAFDEKTFPRTVALILAPVTAIYWGYIMALSPISALILTAVIIGVVVKGKIDNIAFIMGVLCVYVAFFFLSSSPLDFIFIYPIALISISIAGILDEVGNDFVDKNNIYHTVKHFGKYIHLFFEYRFVMKIVVFSFALLNFFPLIYFFAFLAWDIGYASVMRYSKHLVAHRKFYYDDKAINY
jgi:hypothetical protein